MVRGYSGVNFLGVFLALFAPVAAAGAGGTMAGTSGTNVKPGAASDARSNPLAAKPAIHRDRFLVAPFVDAGATKTFTHLRAGIPVLLAERLSQHPGLRAGGPVALVDGKLAVEQLVEKASGLGARWVVAGSYERLKDWRLRVKVSVYAAGAPAAPVAEAEQSGTKDAVVTTTVGAALDALAKLGVVATAAQRAAMTAPFGRDVYAFTLYARGVGAYTGLDGKPASSERAVQVLQRSLLIDPKVPETRRYLGMVHMVAGRPGHARAAWSYVVDARPGYLAAQVDLAALDRAAGLPAARERYAKVLHLDPDDLEARRAYGELLHEAGILEQAEAELQRVVAAAPGDLRARRALALVLAARHAGGALAAQLTEVVRLDPEDIDARMELGAAYTSIGKTAEAAAAYEEVLRRKPKHSSALKLLGDVYRGRKELAKAAACYEKLRRIAPDDPRPVFLLGAAQYEAGQLDAAERSFTEATRYPGMLGEAYSNLGAIAVKRGQPKQALWFLQRAAHKRPGKALVRYNYALALQSLQRFDEAMQELQAATAADPEDAGVRFLTGVVALRMGRLSDAEQAFREALRLDPRNADARHNLTLLESLSNAKSESSITFGQ